MGTRTVYVSAAEPVTKSVDCGGCASVKVHRRVCTEREVSCGFFFLLFFFFCGGVFRGGKGANGMLGCGRFTDHHGRRGDADDDDVCLSEYGGVMGWIGGE